jgi:uncharacterized protein YbjT (DUF2867 family)
MILVTAAAGHQGTRLIPRLARAGVPIRGLRASPGGEAELRALGATEALIGDVRDPAVLARAMEGVDAVYHVCPGGAHLWEREMGFGVIDAAIAAGVRHVVYSSVIHPMVTELIQHETKRDVEERLVTSPLNFTILQPPDYMQFLIPPGTFDSGELVMAWSVERRRSTIDLEDLATVAAKVLLEGEPHYGATYELSAPGCFNGHEIAATISRVTGRRTTVTRIPLEEFVAAQAEQHLRTVNASPQDRDGPEFQMRVLRAIGAWYDSHDLVGNPNVLTMLLGRPPTTLDAFIRREYEEATGKGS